MTDTHIILDSEQKFHRAKVALVELWNRRAEVALHEIEIREHKADKSRAQEKFYWGYVVTPFAEHCGNSPEDLHRIICCALYGTHEIEFKGRRYEMPNKTTTYPKKMNVKEYSDHILMASAMAAEQGVYVQPFEAVA